MTRTPRASKQPHRTRASARSQRGSIAPMIIGFTIILLLLIGVVVAASKLFLFRQEISALADGAALSAADGIDTGSIYNGSGGDVVLDPAAAHQLAGQYLADSGAWNDFPGFHFDSNVTGATRVEVTVGANCKLPLVSYFMDSTIPVSVTAEAQSQRR